MKVKVKYEISIGKDVLHLNHQEAEELYNKLKELLEKEDKIVYQFPQTSPNVEPMIPYCINPDSADKPPNTIYLKGDIVGSIISTLKEDN